MGLSYGNGRLLYFWTGGLALLVAAVCVFFSIVGGLGQWFVFATAMAALMVGGGLGRGVRNPVFGARLSGLGALLCALVVGVSVLRLLRVVMYQPRQSGLLVVPVVCLLVVVGHAGVAVGFGRRG